MVLMNHREQRGASGGRVEAMDTLLEAAGVSITIERENISFGDPSDVDRDGRSFRRRQHSKFQLPSEKKQAMKDR